MIFLNLWKSHLIQYQRTKFTRRDISRKKIILIATRTPLRVLTPEKTPTRSTVPKPPLLDLKVILIIILQVLKQERPWKTTKDSFNSPTDNLLMGTYHKSQWKTTSRELRPQRTATLQMRISMPIWVPIQVLSSVLEVLNSIKVS